MNRAVININMQVSLSYRVLWVDVQEWYSWSHGSYIFTYLFLIHSFVCLFIFETGFFCETLAGLELRSTCLCLQCAGIKGTSTAWLSSFCFVWRRLQQISTVAILGYTPSSSSPHTDKEHCPACWPLFSPWENILIGVRWNLKVVCVCISLMAKNVEYF